MNLLGFGALVLAFQFSVQSSMCLGKCCVTSIDPVQDGIFLREPGNISVEKEPGKRDHHISCLVNKTTERSGKKKLLEKLICHSSYEFYTLEAGDSNWGFKCKNGPNGSIQSQTYKVHIECSRVVI